MTSKKSLTAAVSQKRIPRLNHGKQKIASVTIFSFFSQEWYRTSNILSECEKTITSNWMSRTPKVNAFLEHSWFQIAGILINWRAKATLRKGNVILQEEIRVFSESYSQKVTSVSFTIYTANSWHLQGSFFQSLSHVALIIHNPCIYMEY